MYVIPCLSVFGQPRTTSGRPQQSFRDLRLVQRLGSVLLHPVPPSRLNTYRPQAAAGRLQSCLSARYALAGGLTQEPSSSVATGTCELRGLFVRKCLLSRCVHFAPRSRYVGKKTSAEEPETVRTAGSQFASLASEGLFHESTNGLSSAETNERSFVRLAAAVGVTVR